MDNDVDNPRISDPVAARAGLIVALIIVLGMLCWWVAMIGFVPGMP